MNKLLVNKETGEMFAVKESSKLFLKAKASPVGTIVKKKSGKYRIKTASGWKPYKKGAGKETAKLVVKQDSRKPKEVTPAEQGEAAARSDAAKANKIESLKKKRSDLIKEKNKYQGIMDNEDSTSTKKWKSAFNKFADLSDKAYALTKKIDSLEKKDKKGISLPFKNTSEAEKAYKKILKQEKRDADEETSEGEIVGNAKYEFEKKYGVDFDKAVDTLEKVGSKLTTGEETEALAEAGKENIKGIKKWVEDYKQARKYGNIKLAKKLKKDIDSQIKKYNLNRNEIYGKDPEKERIESEIKSRKLVIRKGKEKGESIKDQIQKLNNEAVKAYKIEKDIEAKFHGPLLRSKEAKAELAKKLKDAGVRSFKEIKKERIRLRDLQRNK